MELKDGLYKIKRGNHHILVEFESVGEHHVHMTCIKTGNSDTFLWSTIIDYFDESDDELNFRKKYDKIEKADIPLINYSWSNVVIK